MTYILELRNGSQLPPDLQKMFEQLVKSVGLGADIPESALNGSWEQSGECR